MMLIKKPDEFRGIRISRNIQKIFSAIYSSILVQKNMLHSAAKTHLLVATIAFQKKTDCLKQ